MSQEKEEHTLPRTSSHLHYYVITSTYRFVSAVVFMVDLLNHLSYFVLLHLIVYNNGVCVSVAWKSLSSSFLEFRSLKGAGALSMAGGFSWTFTHARSSGFSSHFYTLTGD